MSDRRVLEVKINDKVVWSQEVTDSDLECKKMHLRPWIRRNYGNVPYTIAFKKKRIKYAPRITLEIIQKALRMRENNHTIKQAAIAFNINESSLGRAIIRYKKRNYEENNI